MSKKSLTTSKRLPALLFALLSAVLAVLCCAFSAQAAAPGADSGTFPALPSAPPPRIDYSKQPVRKSAPNSIRTSAGWQIISFPVGKVTAVWGLDRMLYKLSCGSYKVVDPVNNPQGLEAGAAYIAYMDNPSIIFFTGENRTGISTKLDCGWNYVCIPSATPGNSGPVTFTNYKKETILPADLKEQPSWPESSWFAKEGGLFSNGRWNRIDHIQGLQLSCGQIFALYCREPLTLNWNVNVKRSLAPSIDQISPAQQKAGQWVIVKGQNLGTADTGCVSIAGQPVPAANVSDWHPNYIKFRIPGNAVSGTIRVCSNGQAGQSGYLAVDSTGPQQQAMAFSAKPSQPAAPKLPAVSQTSKAVSAQTAAGSKMTAPSAQAKAAQKIPQTSKPQPKAVSKPQAKAPAVKAPQTAAKAQQNAIDKQIADIQFDVDSTAPEVSEKTLKQKASSAPSSDEIAYQYSKTQSESPNARPEQQKIMTPGRNPLTGEPSAFMEGLGTSGSYVSGEVVDRSGKPIADARVALSTGQTTLTGSSGTFRIDGVPSGRPMQIAIMKSGYNGAKGTVASIAPGQGKRIKIELSGGSSYGSSYDRREPEKKLGTFTVKAETLRVGPKERQVYVYKIEVSQEGGSKHWSNTWWDFTGDSYTELTCKDAIMDESYNITITWKGTGRRQRERTERWSKKFKFDGETFTFEHP